MNQNTSKNENTIFESYLFCFCSFLIFCRRRCRRSVFVVVFISVWYAKYDNLPKEKIC